MNRDELLTPDVLNDVQDLVELFKQAKKNYELENLLYVIVSAFSSFALLYYVDEEEFATIMRRCVAAYRQSASDIKLMQSKTVGHA